MSKYAEMSKKIVDTLGLKKEPVAITLIKKGQPYPEGYSEPATPVRHCQSIMKARHGEMIVVPGNKQACPVGGSALGLVPLPEKVKSGEFHHNIGMYETPEAASKTLAARAHLEPDKYIATALAPLSKATLEPDVVVFTGTPEQMFWLIPAATTFNLGGRVTVDMAAVQASCVDSTVIPYVTGNVNISLGCFGCRKTTDIAPEEMLVGVPGKKLAELAKSLEKMAASGTIQKARTRS
jgi:uncharacterized protein (DUF169 family)